jgi:tRNA pseudouridine55 synthase
VRLYQHARRGRVVDVPARAVTVHLIELIAWEAPVATVAIECSKGTYIRSIARDLGDALGVPAHLANLVRVRSGPFNLDEAWT